MVREDLDDLVDAREDDDAVVRLAPDGPPLAQRAVVGRRILEEFGHHVVAVDLTPVGHPRRSARTSVIGDGFVMLRHPDLEATLEMADRVATEVQLYAS